MFFWGSNRPRISKHVLYAHSINGGLSVPNLQAYYTAVSIAPLSHLHKTYQLLLYFIVVDFYPIPNSSLPWLPPIHCDHIRTMLGLIFLIVGLRLNFLQAWSVIISYFTLFTAHYLLWVVKNPTQFFWWTANGFVNIHSLFMPTSMTCDAVQSSHNLPLWEYYLQSKHFFFFFFLAVPKNPALSHTLWPPLRAFVEPKPTPIHP